MLHAGAGSLVEAILDVSAAYNVPHESFCGLLERGHAGREVR